MKGRLAVKTIISLVIAVLVIAVAVYFLIFVANFDNLFLSNDQRILMTYATCALAYCSAGAESDEVNAIGCLKYEAGKCVLSCAQVEEKIYQDPSKEVRVTFRDFVGRPHYCGPASSIPFEFSGLFGPVELRSGQMERITNPVKWVCDDVKFPFTDISIPNSAESLYHGLIIDPAFGLPLPFSNFKQSCVMLSGDVPVQIGATVTSGKGGCFSGLAYNEGNRGIFYTPIFQYDSKNIDTLSAVQTPYQATYPSGIYVDESFTIASDGSEPECEYYSVAETPLQIEKSQEVLDERSKKLKERYSRVPAIRDLETKKTPVTVDPIDPQIETDPSSDFGRLVGKCKFDTQRGGKKITYSVYAKPVALPYSLWKKGTQDFLTSIGAIAKLWVDVVLDPFNSEYETEAKAAEEGLNQFFTGQLDAQEQTWSQTTGSCATIVLTREVSSKFVTDQEQTATSQLTFSEPQPVTNIKNPANSPFALVDGGKIYLFYQRNYGTTFDPAVVGEIYYLTSSDGKSWDIPIENNNGRFTDQTLSSAYEPNAASFSGKVYAAYGERKVEDGQTKYSIRVRSLDGTYDKTLSKDASEKGGPSMAVFGGKLYLFYHKKEGDGRYKIYYATWDGKVSDTGVDWTDSILVPTSTNGHMNAGLADSMFPSAYAVSDGVLLSFSYSADQNKVLLFTYPGLVSFDIYAEKFNGASVITELGKVSDDEANNLRRQGFSKILQKDGETYVFYDEDRVLSDPVKSIQNLKTHVGYKKLVGSEWQSTGEIFVSDKLPEGKSKALQPAPMVFGDKLILFFSSYENDEKKWDILSSEGVKSTVPTIFKELSVSVDKESYKVGDTITVTGKLELLSGSFEGKRVFITITSQQRADVVAEFVDVDKETGEFTLTHMIQGPGTYKATAEFNDNKRESNTFAVSAG